MNVPLDRLYNFLGDVCNQDVIIYRFLPHGSKNFDDCYPIRTEPSWFNLMTKPHVLCYDQETIDLHRFPLNHRVWTFEGHKYQSQQPYPWFKKKTEVPYQLFNHVILVHSELNSEAIESASKVGYIPVHWFVHGIIARDWFRYAEADPSLNWNIQQWQHKFLVYNRAWSGSREYRLKFAEQLIHRGLLSQCVTSIGHKDNHVHYTQYQFKNPVWKPSIDLEQYFNNNDTNSNASADYVQKDYADTALEIVLETHFDTRKNHLTEKTLRPIAMGKPFVLATSAHGLKYLKRYGFRTFAPWIDESYDDIEDPQRRLSAVLDEMQRLNQLSASEFTAVIANCLAVAAYNRQRFFSADFFNQIVDELKQGMQHAVDVCKSGATLDNWQQWAQHQNNPPDIEPVLKYLGLGKYQHELV